MKWNNKILCSCLALLSAIVFSVLFVYIFSQYVPFDMDEFIAYHAFACRYFHFNSWNSFTMACGELDLSLPPEISPVKIGLPLRSYPYVGSAMTLIYYPLFIIWKSPLSGRLLGVLMLLAQSLFLSRIFNLRCLAIFGALLAWFPYAFQHTVDLGQLSFQTTSIIIITYLFRCWLYNCAKNRTGKALANICAIAAVVSFGLWIRLSYLFLLPGIIILLIGIALSHRKLFFAKKNIALIFLHAFIGSLLFLSFSLLLLFSQDIDGNRYYEQIYSKSPSGKTGITTQIITHFTKDLSQYLLNPKLASHYIFSVPHLPSIAGILCALLILIFFANGVASSFYKGKPNWFLISTILSFVVTIASISYSPSSWAMHHVVLAYPFLLLGTISVYKYFHRSKAALYALLILIALQCTSYLEIPGTPRRERGDGLQLIALNEALNSRLAQSHVIVIVDWGMYFIKQLYGPQEQMVLYINPLKSENQIIELKNILNTSHRKLAVVYLEPSLSDLQVINSAFPLLHQADEISAAPWRVSYEP